jgi:hypothetical protein
VDLNDTKAQLQSKCMTRNETKLLNISLTSPILLAG